MKHNKAHPQKLIESENVQRCSACGFPFNLEEFPSIPEAFIEHVATFHTPKRKTKQEFKTCYSALSPADQHRDQNKGRVVIAA
jgi:hypothetical protein